MWFIATVMIASLTVRLARCATQVTTIYCDVIVAGGSTAAMAAAISAARRSPDIRVCLTEPTDWLGGQLTAAGVPAIDFGDLNRKTKFQASDFSAMLSTLGAGNPGNCWVSTKCYEPENLVRNWINQTVSSYKNLTVLYNTVVKNVFAQGREIAGIEAVQRFARRGVSQWKLFYSESVSDWYSYANSEHFTKSLLHLVSDTPHPPVLIEATELGDVLVLSGASFRQGVETPVETSTQTLDTCGQAFTFPFYMELFNHSVSGGNWPNYSYPYYSLGTDWGKIWSYRRVLTAGGQIHEALPGEISNQNWGNGNDYKNGYLLLSLRETLAQKGDWRGGLNLKSVHEAELQAYGWYWFYRHHAAESIRDGLDLVTSRISGTQTGLSKIPYVRDTRRSIGIGDFLLTKKDMTANYNSPHGVNFTDSISLGNYYAADVHGLYHCNYPHYVNVNAIKPYVIPFRALTNKDFDNLLVAGKTMAQTFLANAATRLHPMEWSTGLSAGLAAALMRQERISSRALSERIHDLQTEVTKYMPIFWPHSNADDLHVGGDLIIG